MSGDDVLWQSVENHWVPVACVHFIGMSTIEGSELEEFHCIRMYVCVYIRTCIH